MTRTTLGGPCVNEAQMLDVRAFQEHRAKPLGTSYTVVEERSVDSARAILNGLCCEWLWRCEVVALRENLGQGEAVRPRPMGKVRQGMTVIELLCTVVVIGLLLALGVPAIQSARETARRAQCENNLRQLGLANHQYHDIHKTLPVNMGPWRVPPSGSPALNGKGWIVSVLPHIEQQPLFDAFTPYFGGDFLAGSGLMSPGCRELMKTRVPLLRCPSDGSAASPLRTFYQWEGIEVAPTNYKGVIGDTRVGGDQSEHSGSEPDCHALGGCNGLFFRTTYREPQRFSMVLDGMSNTLLFGEDVVEHNDHSAAFYSNGDWASCYCPLNYFPSPPASRDWPNVMSFRSRHPQGATFCLADGSVRFVSQRISHSLYRGLSTKNGGEPASVP